MDKLPILMTRAGNRLVPMADLDAERIGALTYGQPVEVTVRQRRSSPSHRHLFSVLHSVVRSGATPFPTVDALLDALKMTLGCCELRQTLDGKTFYVPGSISYAAKDQAAFNEFKEACFRLLTEHYGIPADVFDPRIRSAA